MTCGRIRSAAAAGAILVCLGLGGIASAQSASGTHAPDPKRGAVIAAQGTAAGAPGCAQCHAFNGAADGSGAFPRIAGQSSFYLAKQLRDFSSNVRVNAIMSPIAKALTPDDIADVAAYYAGLHPSFLPLRNADPSLIRSGEQLAKVGNDAKGIQACDNCHGPAGTGEPPAIPYLAGQYAPYVAFELRMWQRGFRKSSPNQMAEVAKLLNDPEMAAVAAYYQQVRGSADVAASP
jgi:cytochrome c553